MAINKHRTSLKDLAKELGVSIATVSRALRNSPEIGAEMQEKVKALAKKLNYRPNPFAQSLRKEAPRVIGVVVPNLVTHYYAAVLDGIEDEARESGYSVICANTHEDSEREVQAIDNFINLHVEGIIACLAQSTTDYKHFEKLENEPIDTVFNCAANVKHFSNGTDIEDINVGGVVNCIRLCEKIGARLIHFSTISVSLLSLLQLNNSIIAAPITNKLFFFI